MCTSIFDENPECAGYCDSRLPVPSLIMTVSLSISGLEMIDSWKNEGG